MNYVAASSLIHPSVCLTIAKLLML